MFGLLESKTVSFDSFITELRRMCGLAQHSGIVQGRDVLRLSALQTTFCAHLLNAAGVATRSVVHALEPATAAGHFRWEPAAAGPAPVPPVAVPAVIGVGADVQQVVMVPTREQELRYISQRVAVTPAPRGKVCVRKRSGALKKCGCNATFLWEWVLRNVPDWRDSLALL